MGYNDGPPIDPPKVAAPKYPTNSGGGAQAAPTDPPKGPTLTPPGVTVKPAPTGADIQTGGPLSPQPIRKG